MNKFMHKDHTEQENHLRVMRILERKPDCTQRELAQELEISLGKVNYGMKALIGKGLVKAKNFKNSDKKRAYLYILTPKGIDAKARISLSFLKRKMREYEMLSQEIEQLKAEVDAQGSGKRK